MRSIIICTLHYFSRHIEDEMAEHVARTGKCEMNTKLYMTNLMGGNHTVQRRI
jgi:hypothetical protein